MKSKILFGILTLILLSIAVSFETKPPSGSLSYTQFLETVRNGQVAKAVVTSGPAGTAQANIQLKDGQAARTVLPGDYRDALSIMHGKLVDVEIRDPGLKPSRLVLSASPFLLLLGIWWIGLKILQSCRQ